MVDTEFIDALASKAPTPGGGGASAYGGALGSALASMVGNLTVGKKKYAAVEAEIQESLERLDGLRASLVWLIDEDARVFGPLAASYGMPKETPAQASLREEALQAALKDACEVPLAIMRQCLCVIEEASLMAKMGSRLAVSDAGVAAVFAKAALVGASLNVYINTAAMADKALAERFNREADTLIGKGEDVAARVLSDVMAQIRPV